MKAALILAMSALAIACKQPNDTQTARGASETSDDTTALVIVDRPTAIGFFPPAADSVDKDESGYSEGISHVGFALSDAKACLGGDSSQTFLVVDTAVRIRNGKRVDTLVFSRVDSLSYSVYLVAPGFAPHVVNALGPSALIHFVAEQIPSYFHRPPCREGGARE